ncbi:hypothetical protein ACEQ8H_001462 [Pleosporales sp. CAS-2024a]
MSPPNAERKTRPQNISNMQIRVENEKKGVRRFFAWNLKTLKNPFAKSCPNSSATTMSSEQADGQRGVEEEGEAGNEQRLRYAHQDDEEGEDEGEDQDGEGEEATLLPQFYTDLHPNALLGTTTAGAAPWPGLSIAPVDSGTASMTRGTPGPPEQATDADDDEEKGKNV